MTTPNCLEAAMFAASESYSVSRYDLDDCAAEAAEDGEGWTPISALDPIQYRPAI